MFPNIFFPKGWYHIYSIKVFWDVPVRGKPRFIPHHVFSMPCVGTSVDLFKLFKLWLLLWWDHSPRHYPLTVSFPYITQHASPRQYPSAYDGQECVVVVCVLRWSSSCSAEYIAASCSRTFTDDTSSLISSCTTLCTRDDPQGCALVSGSWNCPFRTEKLLRGWFGGCQ